MTVRRFVREIFSSFFRWWWAAITGVASILSWFGLPASGLTISRWAFVVLIFCAFALTFLAFSVTVQAYRWFVDGGTHPSVVRVAAPAGERPFFVVHTEGRQLTAGQLLSVHRDVQGHEVCLAILRFDRAREDGTGDQCEAIWISPGHQRDLVLGRVPLSHLLVRREIPSDAIDRVNEST